MKRSICLLAAALGMAASAFGQMCDSLAGSPGDQFGCSVATDGGSVAISANSDDDDSRGIPDAGSVTVFAAGKRETIFAGDAAAGDQFGVALDLAGGILAVGAPGVDLPEGADAGAIYVLRQSGGRWEEQRLTAGENARRGAAFGEAVALARDGSLIAVGAPSDSGDGSLAGAAYLFSRSGSGWTGARLNARPDPFDGFGFSVAIDGELLAIGAPFANGSQGEVWIFHRRGEVWAPLDPITAGSFARAGAQFGSAVSLSGGVLAVAATRDDPDGRTDAGAVYLFSVSAEHASFQQRLTPAGLRAGDLFGSAVALDGSRLLVGARLSDQHKGAAYLFEKDAEGRWTEDPSVSLGSAGGEFGQAVALRGDRTVVGAYLHDRADSCDLEEKRPDLTCTIDGPATVAAGGQATYSITVSNVGEAPATSVEIVEVKALGVSLGPFALGTIDEKKESPPTAVTFQVPQGCSAPKSFLPKATVSDSSKEDVTCEPKIPTRVERPPVELECVKTGPASARPGERVFYEVTVRNLGCEAALNVDVADPAPAGLIPDCGKPFCSTRIAKIPPLGSVKVPFSFKVPADHPGTAIFNKAGLSQVQPQETPAARANNFCAATTPVRCLNPFQNPKDPPADLPPGTWGIVEGPTEARQGSRIEYRILLANGGPGPQPDSAGHELEHLLPWVPLGYSAKPGEARVQSPSGAPYDDLVWNGAIPFCGTVTIQVAAKVEGKPDSVVCLQGSIGADADRDGTNETARLTGLRGRIDRGEPLCVKILPALPE